MRAERGGGAHVVRACACAHLGVRRAAPQKK